MENIVNLKIDLPPDILKKLETVIIDTVSRVLQQHVSNIKAEPKMYTRKETANALRVTLPTLRVYELKRRLMPKRAGKRVLYCKKDIEDFIASLRS